MKKGLTFRNEGKAIEIKIYGDIGEKDFWTSLMEEGEEKDESVVASLEELNRLLKDNQDAATIDIYINSNGGNVFDGIAMYNMLKRHRAYKRVFIDGFACSVASVIAMCGNSITMPSTSMMMIHNAWTVAVGNAKELRKVAEDLDQINQAIKNAYRAKIKIKDEELDMLMDDESFLTADQCYQMGFCTKIDDTLDATEEVEKGLDRMTSLYQNKMDSLTALKNAIRDIETAESIEIEDAEQEAEAETVETEVIETVEETEQTVDAIETECEEKSVIDNVEDVKKEIEDIKENALMRFFNFKEEKDESRC